MPDNYIVESIPQPINIKLGQKDAAFTFNILQTDNTIQITSKLMLYKTFYSSLEYTNLRQFYSQMIEAQQKYLVLKKI